MKRGVPGVPLAALGFLAACQAAGPVAGPTPEVSWGEAVAVLNRGEAVEVFQAHSLWVSFTLRDGTSIMAREPQIDAIFHEIDRCQRCRHVLIVTE